MPAQNNSESARPVNLRLPITVRRRRRHLDLSTRTVRLPRSKYLHPILSHKQRMLKLRRPQPIHCDTRPVIRPRLVLVAAQRDHRLDRERHPRLRLADCLVLRIMRYIRRAMEELVHAVPAVRLDDGAIALFSGLFDDVSVVSEQSTGLDECDGCVEAVSRGLNNAHIVWVLGGLWANVVGLIQISVEAIVI